MVDPDYSKWDWFSALGQVHAMVSVFATDFRGSSLMTKEDLYRPLYIFGRYIFFSSYIIYTTNMLNICERVFGTRYKFLNLFKEFNNEVKWTFLKSIKIVQISCDGECSIKECDNYLCRVTVDLIPSQMVWLRLYDCF